MIELVWPYLLLLLPLPLAVRYLVPARAQSEAALHVPCFDAMSEAADANRRSTESPLISILRWLVWILLIMAVVRPQWTGEPVALPTTGRDLMLAVDISGSMGTDDMLLGGERVDRLTVVKSVVNDFIARRKGDRIGLILFGSNAYLQSPLTFDRETVNQLLREAPVGIAGGKTAIGDAIGLGTKRLRTRPESMRVLILLTDGKNNIGELEPVKAAELASIEAIRIYTIGVGADEMVMPGIFGSSIGAQRVNPSADLDEQSLVAIANYTGGEYFRARNTKELEGIYRQLDELEPIEQDPETYRPIRGLFHWPLGLALLASFALGLAVARPKLATRPEALVEAEAT